MTGGQLTASARPDGRTDAGKHLAIPAYGSRGSAADGGSDAREGPPRIATQEEADRAGAPPVAELAQYLLDNTEGAATRPRVGASVTIPLDEAECQRARIALRRLSVDAPVTREIEVAAIALEISLERPQGRARNRDRPLTLELDVADCVLMAMALLYASRDGRRDDYCRQARSLLDRVDRWSPRSVEIPAPDV